MPEWFTDTQTGIVVEEGEPPNPDERLINYEPDMLMCRSSRHHLFEPAGDEVLAQRGQTVLLFERHLKCSRCPMEAFDIVNAIMWVRVRHRRYHDPTGRYKLAGDPIDPRALLRSYYMMTNPKLFARGDNKPKRRR